MTMIGLNEHFVESPESAARLRQGLENALDDRWSNYHQAFKRCRKKISENSVHALRVEIRRTLSVLTLLKTVLPPQRIAILDRELKDCLKALSRLRDTHVQTGMIEKSLENEPWLRPLYDWLLRKERRLVKQLKHELAEARHGKTMHRLSKLSRAADELFEGANQTPNLVTVLAGASERAFEDVLAYYRQIGPDNLEAVHRMRIAFKKFRYITEVSAQILPGIAGRLGAMRNYQARMGEIQDVEVLLARVQKLDRKIQMDRLGSTSFRQKLLRRRARLTKRFLASADQLLDFRLPSLNRGFRTGRKHGTVSSPTRNRS